MAQHQLKAINGIGMQTSRILKTVQLLIERKNARKATEDPSINNNFSYPYTHYKGKHQKYHWEELEQVFSYFFPNK